MRRLAALFVTAMVAVLAAGCVGGERDREVDTSPLGPDDPTTYEYVVPFGTGNRIDGGEVVEIMPQQLEVKVGESIRIINDDIRDYMIGPFFVTAGQTLAMRFTHPGKLIGACEINPEGEFVIDVTE